MCDIEIVDFSEWIPYEGFSEGSGRGEKIWLQSTDGEIGLFKYPKFNPDTLDITTEHVSEHMAYQIGNILNIETARVDIGTYHGRMGCMSYLINKSDESLVEGAVFITGIHFDYDLELMQETSTGKYYCIDHLMEITQSSSVITRRLEMLIFDFLIGNTDRHQNNWAFLIKYPEMAANDMKLRACPLYDNGSSLCCYINEDSIDEFLKSNTNRFEALTNTKSRSMIRVDGFKKKRPTHVEVVKRLLEIYPEATCISNEIITKMNDNTINTLIDRYNGILSDKKMQLLKKYLKRKIDILEKLLDEVRL